MTTHRTIREADAPAWAKWPSTDPKPKSWLATNPETGEIVRVLNADTE